jgi:hypothetical protein
MFHVMFHVMFHGCNLDASCPADRSAMQPVMLTEFSLTPTRSCVLLQVVAAAMARGGEEELHRLVQRFRQVFVVACKPKYLPPNWTVDAVDTRQFGEYSVYAKEEAAAVAPGTGEDFSETAAAVAVQDGDGKEEISAVGAEGRNSGAAGVDGAVDGLSIFGHKH